jgi:hypothetical protein
MSGPADKIIDLIYGRWRSQILYAGVELGVFDHVPGIVRNKQMLSQQKLVLMRSFFIG